MSAMGVTTPSRDGSPRERRCYMKEMTLVVDVEDNSKIKPETIIRHVISACGEGSLLACVPKSGMCMN